MSMIVPTSEDVQKPERPAAPEQQQQQQPVEAGY